MFPSFSSDINYLYYFVEATRHNLLPFRSGINGMNSVLNKKFNPFTRTFTAKSLRASFEIAERLTRKYSKPTFGIDKCDVNGKEVAIKIENLHKDPFCNLLHFKKVNHSKNQPKILIVAPMAGHHATLLRGTVIDILPFFDVYITDWIDANQVPICDGSFDLDSYIDYVINYISFLGPNIHVYAVCQPTVPVLAATALMSEINNNKLPKSLILTGGPIDARKNPTIPNEFAIRKNLEWFDSMMISSVPANYPGYRRRVYPGFLQLIGFVNLYVQRHIDSHYQLYKNLIIEDNKQAEKQKKFYDEYFSVMDLTAEFYLQTIKEVFQDFALARGKFVSRGRKVNLNSIKK